MYLSLHLWIIKRLSSASTEQFYSKLSMFMVIPKILIRANLFTITQKQVITPDGNTETSLIQNVLFQGYTLALFLIIIDLDYAMSKYVSK